VTGKIEFAAQHIGAANRLKLLETFTEEQLVKHWNDG